MRGSGLRIAITIAFSPAFAARWRCRWRGRRVRRRNAHPREFWAAAVRHRHQGYFPSHRAAPAHLALQRGFMPRRAPPAWAVRTLEWWKREREQENVERWKRLVAALLLVESQELVVLGCSRAWVIAKVVRWQ
jgi:hypothetical protein